MKLFNSGLLLMVIAVIALPVMPFISSSDGTILRYGFYFCGLLELIGLTLVLMHIIRLKRKKV